MAPHSGAAAPQPRGSRPARYRERDRTDVKGRVLATYAAVRVGTGILMSEQQSMIMAIAASAEWKP